MARPVLSCPICLVQPVLANSVNLSCQTRQPVLSFRRLDFRQPDFKLHRFEVVCCMEEHLQIPPDLGVRRLLETDTLLHIPIRNEWIPPENIEK